MSDWSKVTRPIPVPNDLTKPFWEAAKRGVLALQRCQACRRFQHPPYATCVNCMAIDLAFEPVRRLWEEGLVSDNGLYAAYDLNDIRVSLEEREKGR